MAKRKRIYFYSEAFYQVEKRFAAAAANNFHGRC